jgi:hypothetical protein
VQHFVLQFGIAGAGTANHQLEQGELARVQVVVRSTRAVNFAISAPPPLSLSCTDVRHHRQRPLDQRSRMLELSGTAPAKLAAR